MFGSLGAPEILIILSIVAPALIIWRVTVSRGVSRVYIWWGLLGWLGLIIALVTMPKARQ